MKNKSLTLFSYYGGKARWSKDIASLLDYDTTDIYIEPFGGACSVLLNKIEHPIEIYSDLSRGLTALIKYLSKPDTAEQLIDSLYDTEYSEDCFNEYLEYKNRADANILADISRKKIKLFNKTANLGTDVIERIIKYYPNILGIDDIRKLNDSHIEILSSHNELLNDKRIFTKSNKNAFEKLKARKEEVIALPNSDIINLLSNMSSFDINENVDESISINDFELAKATYVVYSMSRDGMGSAFSTAKYKTTEHYHRGIDNLYRIAERLENVHVAGTVNTFMYMLFTAYKDQLSADFKDLVPLSFADFEHKRTMFYLDPPYLSTDEKMNDLGTAYTGKMTYTDHKTLLETVNKSNAKFLISNYDNELYSDMLKDWHKTTIETVTGVGSKKNNKRVECLWSNY